LRQSVRALLHRGERRIVLDLARVSAIDAAGVGELVCAYKLTTAATGAFQIVNASRRVHQMLERAGVFHVLSGQRRDE
jgi:anti-anti-sigma factor